MKLNIPKISSPSNQSPQLKTKKPPVPIIANDTDNGNQLPDKTVFNAPRRFTGALAGTVVEQTGKTAAMIPKVVENAVFDPLNTVKGASIGLGRLVNSTVGAGMSLIGKITGNDKLAVARDKFKATLDEGQKLNWSIKPLKDIANRSSFAENVHENLGGMSERSGTAVTRAVGGFDNTEDMDLVEKVGSAIGSSIPSIALAIASGGESVLAKAGTMASIEAAQNADQVYSDLIKQGKSDQEASNAAAANFSVDLVIGFVTDKLGIFNDNIKGVIKKAVLSTPPEVIQEVAQQINQNVNAGRPAEEGLGETALVTAIMAPLLGGSVGALESFADKKGKEEIKIAVKEEFVDNKKTRNEVVKDMVEVLSLPEIKAAEIVDEVIAENPEIAQAEDISPDKLMGDFNNILSGINTEKEAINTQAPAETVDTQVKDSFESVLNEIPDAVHEEAAQEWEAQYADKMANLVDEEMILEEDLLAAVDDTEKAAIEEKLNDIIDQQENLKDEFISDFQKDDLAAPSGVAKSFIRPYVERGDTMKSIKDGQGGMSIPGGYSVSIKGDKIVVERDSTGKVVNETFSLKKMFDEIKTESESSVETKKIREVKPKTQKEKVAKAIEENPKSIKQIADETGIVEPNIRRILGVGAKEGVFSRVDKGVYIVSKNDKDIAYIHNGDAVETLKTLVNDGVKVDMVFLDIPYDTPAVKGGNRGVKYDLLSVAQFGSVLDSVKALARDSDTPVIHMYSQAASGMKEMQKYNDLFIKKGFKPVGNGQYQKTFADGSPVTSPNGKVSKPEGIIVFTQSGELKQELGDLNFEFKRPKGYQTEKPAEMLKALIEMTTNEGDTVLDPFAGSGVTGAEAVKAGRKTIAIEKNKKVAEEITTPRIENAVDEMQDNGTIDSNGNIGNNKQADDGDAVDTGGSEGLPDVTTVPVSNDTTGGDEATGEISGYDEAQVLVESGNGFGRDTAASPRIGKKGRQLINEQVEQILETKDYSTNPDDYSAADIELMRNYTGAGGKESVGATGSGLLDEYYTPVPLINNIWDIVQKLTPNAATAFEPSTGIGRFISNSPTSIQVDGAEIQKVSGTIAQILNPDSNIIVGDFQEVFFDKKTNKQKTGVTQYDVVVGNPPFGDRAGFLKGKGEEPKINRQEEYFIKRGLDMLKEDGYLVYVVNSSFLKTGASLGKERISQIGKLVQAFRLPENSFEDTAVGTDIVVFKKVDGDMVDTLSRHIELRDDNYFKKNPDNILGQTEIRKNRFGQTETYVKGDFDTAMTELRDKINSFSKNLANYDVVTKTPIRVFRGTGAGIGNTTFVSGKYYADSIEFAKTFGDNIEEFTIPVGSKMFDFDAIKNDFKQSVIPQTILVDPKATREFLLSKGYEFTRNTNTRGVEYVDLTQQKPIDELVDIAKGFSDKVDFLKYLAGKGYETNKDLLSKVQTGDSDVAWRLAHNIDRVPSEKTVKTVKTTTGPKKIDASYQLAPKENYQDLVVPVQNISSQTFYSPTEVAMLSRIERDGSIPNVSSDEMRFANYYDGKMYHDVNYFSGEVYKKLDALAKNRKVIIEQFGQAQYDKQKAGLDAIVPQRVTIDNIVFDPLDRHVVNMKIDETNTDNYGATVGGQFKSWIRNNDVALSPNVHKYDIQNYVNGARADKDTKKIMGHIRKDAKRLFNTFLKTDLDPAVQKRIEDIYNKEKNGYVEPNFSAIPIEIKDMAKDFRGRPFEVSIVQGNGIGFLVNKGSGLIAYGVGVGKTHTLALATVANMQKGWTKRPLFIVPQATISKTWIDTLHSMFPGLVINNLSGLQAPVVRKIIKAKGEDRTKWISDNELTIISHEGILRLGFKEDELREAAGDIKDALWTEPKTARGGKLDENKYDEILGNAQKYVTDTMLSDLGFDHISVDEVHNFRKVFQGAKAEEDNKGSKKRYSNIVGGTPSKRAQQLFLISQYIQKRNGNRNVFLASATPFENHATEVYNILSFVARDRMKEMGIHNINDFFSAYADFEVELDRSLNGEIINREKMKSFANIESLQKLLREFVDFQVDETLVRPERKVMTPQLKMSALQEKNLENIQMLLDGKQPIIEITNADGDEAMFDTTDTPDGKKDDGAFLKASTYSIANSVSPYFIKEYAPKGFTKEELIENSPKIQYAMEVLKQLKNNPKTKDYGTFIFFGKMGVEYHPMIKNWIVENIGYKADEVAVLSGNVTEAEKEEIKDKFNDGRVKVLLGGDQTKEGIDLQNNGFVTMNLALGWNPTQIAQVEGRVWRQGNNRNIAPLIYPLVENSGDATIYSKFEEKGGRINDLFSYKGTIFDVGEIDPAEKKLALMTNPSDKAKMAVEIDKISLGNERVYIESDVNDVKRMWADMKSLNGEIETDQKKLDTGEDRWGGKLSEADIKEIKRDIKSNQDKVERIAKKFADRGIDNPATYIADAEVRLSNINDEIKAVNDTYEQKLKEFTAQKAETERNRKTMDDHMADIQALIDQLQERTPDEVAQLRKERVAAYQAKQTVEAEEDSASMTQFVTGEKELIDAAFSAQEREQRRLDKQRADRERQEVKRGKEFLLAQLEKSSHRKMYAGVRLEMEDDLTDIQRAEMSKKLSYDIPVEQVRAVAYLVDSLPETLFDQLGTRVTRTESPTPGRYSFTRKVMELSTKLIAEDGGQYSRTIIHELWHHLSSYLPDTDIAIIRRDYTKQRDVYVKNNPWFAKYHIDKDGREADISQKQLDELIAEYPQVDIEKNFSGNYIETSGGVRYKPMYTAENYRYKNIDEWFAEMMADRSLKYIADTSIQTRSVWAYMKQIMRILSEAIRRAFGYDRAGRFLSDFMAGEYMDMQRDTSLDKTISVAFNVRKKEFEKMPPDLEEFSKAHDLNLTKKDIGFISDTFLQAREIYLADPQSFKEADELRKTGEKRVMEKNILDNKFNDMMNPYFKLNKSSQTKVNMALMEGDKLGKEFVDAELTALGFSKPQIDAYKSVRTAFKSAHAFLLEQMRAAGVSEEDVAEFEKTKQGYMPHKWKYRFAVKTQVYRAEKDAWETDTMDTFRTKAEAEKVSNEMRIKAGTDPDIRFTVDTLDNLDVDFFTEQRFSFENMKSIMEKAKTSDEVKKEMLSAMRNAIKEKGFGRHFIQRNGIEGYEQTEVPLLIVNYFAGFSGFVTKMNAGKEYYETLAKIDARRQKNFYRFARDLVAYDMGNRKEYHGLKQLAFAYYLANDLSFLLTNSTQNLVVGTGELSKLYQNMGGKFVGPEIELTRATKDWNFGTVTEREKEVIDALVSAGRLGGEMVAELTGFKNNPLYRNLGNGMNFALYRAASYAEKNINRVPAFLAARRILLKQGMTEKDANERALELSDDIHFRQGKINRPKIARGLPGIVTMYWGYLFRFMESLRRDLSHKEFTAVSKRLFYTFALGGATALPFAKMLIAIFKLLVPNADDSDREELSKWEIFLKKGIPAAFANIDMSNNVSLDLLSLTKLLDSPNGESIWKQLGQVKTYAGTVWGLGERGVSGVNMIRDGREAQGLGNLLPDFIANPIKAVVGATRGVQSKSGTPLIDEDGKPFKYTSYEAFVKATGFTPTRESLAWDAQGRKWDAETIQSGKATKDRNKVEKAVEAGNYDEARRLEAESKAAGIMSEGKEYAGSLIQDKLIEKHLKTWESGDKTTGRLHAIERDIARQSYGEDYSKNQLTATAKEFAYRRYFGYDNTVANKLWKAASNAEKVKVLKEAKASMTADEFREFYSTGRKPVTYASGRSGNVLISDDLRDLLLGKN